MGRRNLGAHRAELAGAAVVLAGVALLVLHARRLWFYTEEDAYILARYVRNLAAGRGLVYNAGEPEWGCTTTLLPLLLAPLAWLGVPPVIGAKLLGVTSAGAAGVRLAQSLARYAPPWISSLVLLPIAAFPPLVLWAVGGLETAVFAALVILSLTAALDERSRAATRWPRSLVWLLLATLARDDAPIYAPAVLLAAWDGDWRRAARWAARFGGGVVVLWAAHAYYYDAWLPNSFLSKVRGIPDKERLGAAYVRQFAVELWPLLAAAAAAMVICLARPGPRRRDALALSVALGTSAVYSAWAGGDWMPGYRFLAPTILFGAPLLVLASSSLEELLPRGRLAVHALTVAGVALLSLSLYAREDDWLPRLHVLRTANDVFLRVGDAARGGDPALTYALVDIGGFGWGSEARVLDLRGLTDHTIAGAPNTASGPIAKEALERRRPDVVLVKSNVLGDTAALRSFYDAIVKLDRQPLTVADTEALLRRPLSQGDADAAEYLRGDGHFRIVNLPVFPEMGQFYVVAARADVIPRLPPSLTATRFNTGIAYYEIGRKERGMTMMQAELAANPWDELGRLEQSSRLIAAERAPEAVPLLEELLKLAPYSADAYNNLGFALATQGRFADAVPPLEKALRLRPDFTLARNNLAWVRTQVH